MIKQCCNASVSTLTLNETSNLNPHEKVLFLLGCPIFSLEDLLAQRVLRFVSSALEKIYKIRTERRLELEAPWLMKYFFSLKLFFVIYILDFVLYFRVVIFIVLICKYVIGKIKRRRSGEFPQIRSAPF